MLAASSFLDRAVCAWSVSQAAPRTGQSCLDALTWGLCFTTVNKREDGIREDLCYLEPFRDFFFQIGVFSG